MISPRSQPPALRALPSLYTKEPTGPIAGTEHGYKSHSPTQLHPGQMGKGAAGDISFALVPQTDFPVRTVLQQSHFYSYNTGSDQGQGSALGYAALKTLGYLT